MQSATRLAGRPRIRLLLADVDGTLLTPEKTLSPATLAAVGELHRAGIVFAITSGRPPRGMQMFIKPLDLQVASAGFDGGIYFNPDLSIIAIHRIDPATARSAVQLILGLGLDAWVYTEDQWLVRDAQAPHVARETSNVRFEATLVAAFADLHLAHVVKIVGVSNDFALVAACERALQTTLGGRASAARSQPFYVDVTHPQATKGAVLDTLSKLLAIAPAQIATIGDMPNDISMFRRSGLSITMGNASDEVKAQSSAVTDSNACDGFANAVRALIV